MPSMPNSPVNSATSALVARLAATPVVATVVIAVAVAAIAVKTVAAVVVIADP